MAERDRPHIFLTGWARPEPYTSHAAGGGRSRLPERDRHSHGTRLRESLEHEAALGIQRRQQADVDVGVPPTGIYLTFESVPDVELALESLENRRLKHPAELVAVRVEERDDGPVQVATVFVPDEAVSSFVRKVEAYLSSETASGAPRNRNLVDRIEQVRLATLEGLWTEATVPFPAGGEPVWWEVWLRRDEGRELDRFLTFADAVDAHVGPRRLAFDDRTVVLVRAAASQLAQSVAVLDDLAELRQARVPAEFFAFAPPAEQAEWVEDLLGRVSFTDAEYAPRVCILDSGVRAEHPLLRPALDPDDLHAVDPGWGTADDRGHGTEMAGLALYGDALAEALAAQNPLTLAHRLESVKILPRPPANNDPDLYGAIAAEAVARVETQAPERRRAFSMAVTAAIPGPDSSRAFGQPTSWSSAIDAVAIGRSFESLPEGLNYLDQGDLQASRLLVVAAGNIARNRWDRAHLDRSDVEPVHDPAHAWNALTVGAYTSLTDPGVLDGYQPVAQAEELSPHSSTSVAFRRQWPIKPDVLCEGGNVAVSDADHFDTPESMQLLTTHGRDGSRLLTVSNATSAASAQAARLAALVWSAYPDLWPETVRALIVHGSRWTGSMQSWLEQASTRGAVEALVRRYGMGVPTMEYVLRSATNDLALVAEDTIHPFDEGQLREMQLYELPWPREQLEQLSEAPVRLRVTLSYFIEPNPSRRGWVGRFRYASHGLRFDVKMPTESIQEFRKRLNKQALAEDERRPTGLSDAGQWLLGPVVRHRGSIHTDVWAGTAADLAARGSLAVYPVAGWWKELKARDRSASGTRYALIVSIEAPDVEVDLWTPVTTEVGVSVGTPVIT